MPALLGLPAVIALAACHTPFLRTIEREAIQYGKPVLLVHGDIHVFRVDKALAASGDGRPIGNVTRLESFGEREVHWSPVPPR